MRTIIYIIIAVTFICCKSITQQDDNNGAFHNTSNESQDSAAIYVNLWKSDTCGCEHLRTLEMAERIFAEYDLYGKPIDSIVKYLGSDFDGTIGYDVKSFCEDGAPLEGARRISTLIFHKGRLLYNSIPYTRQQ